MSDSTLDQVRQIIRDYHYALDMREHGGIATNRAFDAICTLLDMPWVQGEELARRGGTRVGIPDTEFDAAMKLVDVAVKRDYPECSGDPSSCPENEGYGCCKPNPRGASCG